MTTARATLQPSVDFHPVAKPNPTAATGFLTAWFGEHVDDDALISIWTYSDKKTRFCSSIDEAATYATARADTSDVYFGLCLYRPGITGGRGTASDMVCATGVWADIDVWGDGHERKNYPPTEADALAIANDLGGGIHPTIIIHSGGGLHVYWRLKEPITDNADAARFVKRFGDTIQARAAERGFGIDAVFDLARVLRVPGTVNHKNGNRRPVEIVTCDEARTFDREHLEGVLLDEQPDGNGKVTLTPADADGRLPERFEATLASDPRFCQTWNHDRPDLKDQSLSAYDMALAGQAVRLDFSDAEIANIIVASRERHGTANDVAKGSRPDYLARTITKARAKVKAEGPGLTEQLADKILQTEHFALDVGGKLLAFKRGTYATDGVKIIRRHVKRALRDTSQKWRSHVRDEVAAYIGDDAPELWDCPPLDRLNLKNGLLDVGTRELRAHDPKFLSPVQIPVEYDADATCPHWGRFVETTFPDDAHDIAWQIVAWLMLPYTGIKKALLLLGEGDTGKSTWLRGVTAFLGKRNVSSATLHALEADRFKVARLVGRLVNIAADLPSAHLVGCSMFKAITGGDLIDAEQKYRDSFEFTPFARLIFSANHPPRSPDADAAFFGRWIVLPFHNMFTEGAEGTIPREVLDAQLTDPAELSGVLNHALAALPRVREHGITVTESMVEAFGEFHEVTDPLAVWLNSNTTDDVNAYTTCLKLRAAFNAAAESAGRPPMQQTPFGRAMNRLRPNAEVKRKMIHGIKGVRCYIGLGLCE